MRGAGGGGKGAISDSRVKKKKKRRVIWAGEGVISDIFYEKPGGAVTADTSVKKLGNLGMTGI